MRRPQRPGNQERAEARVWTNPPGNSPSRITRNRWLCRNALAGTTGTSRLNVRHCAPSPAEQQEKSRVALCRNCECRRFLVESAGKSGHLRGVARTPGRRPADDDPAPQASQTVRPAECRNRLPEGSTPIARGQMPANNYNQSCEILFDQAAEWCHHLQMHFLQAFGGDSRI